MECMKYRKSYVEYVFFMKRFFEGNIGNKDKEAEKHKKKTAMLNKLLTPKIPRKPVIKNRLMTK